MSMNSWEQNYDPEAKQLSNLPKEDMILYLEYDMYIYIYIY